MKHKALINYYLMCSITHFANLQKKVSMDYEKSNHPFSIAIMKHCPFTSVITEGHEIRRNKVVTARTNLIWLETRLISQAIILKQARDVEI